MTATIQLDLNSDTPINVHTHTPEQALPIVVADTRTWLDDAGFTDVAFEVVTVFGSGGGASVIDFTAPNVDRARALATHYDAGNGDVAYLMEGVVEV